MECPFGITCWLSATSGPSSLKWFIILSRTTHPWRFPLSSSWQIGLNDDADSSELQSDLRKRSNLSIFQFLGTAPRWRPLSKNAVTLVLKSSERISTHAFSAVLRADVYFIVRSGWAATASFWALAVPFLVTFSLRGVPVWSSPWKAVESIYKFVLSAYHECLIRHAGSFRALCSTDMAFPLLWRRNVVIYGNVDIIGQLISKLLSNR